MKKLEILTLFLSTRWFLGKKNRKKSFLRCFSVCLKEGVSYKWWWKRPWGLSRQQLYYCGVFKPTNAQRASSQVSWKKKKLFSCSSYHTIDLNKKYKSFAVCDDLKISDHFSFDFLLTKCKNLFIFFSRRLHHSESFSFRFSRNNTKKFSLFNKSSRIPFTWK